MTETPLTPRQERTLALLSNRTTVLTARLTKAQARTRRNVRDRVATGTPITRDELLGAARSLGILYSQLERSLAEEQAYRAKVGR